jgi:alanine racemase
MTFDLHVAAGSWRAHLTDIADRVPGLVPVVKGNGYGFGRDVIADEAGRLGVPQIAVGTYHEVSEALARFDGDVLVMTPWRPYIDVPEAARSDRVIHTVSRLEDVQALAAGGNARVVIEGETSMERHGFDRHELADVAASLESLQVEGFGLHLPLVPANLAEADSWAGRLLTSRLETRTLYVSHLTPDELVVLRARRPELDIRARIGTALWLGNLDALSVQSTVLDVHQVARGERVGYRQRPVPRDGALVVLAGGTSHGIGLEAPRAALSPIDRGKRLARGGLEAAGLALSPFVIDGKHRWFAEPPHMQASLVLVPASAAIPQPGDKIQATVRFTTTSFDSVVLD